MFKEPLRRDPLVVGWALCLLLGATIALSSNTEWRGGLEADRVQTSWARRSTSSSGRSACCSSWPGCARRLARAPAPPPEAQGRRPRVRAALDRPLDQRRRGRPTPSAARADGRAPMPAEPPVVVCRHGVRAGAETPVGQPPVLRALSVSHHIVQPGSGVSVTWCFEHADDVVVDGLRGYPACGEAPVRIRSTRSVEVIGRNRTVETPCATSTVVATSVPPLQPARAAPRRRPSPCASTSPPPSGPARPSPRGSTRSTGPRTAGAAARGAARRPRRPARPPCAAVSGEASR